MSRHERDIKPTPWPTTVICPEPDCEDGTVWVGMRGPNDPEVIAYECETCGGTGEVEPAEDNDDEEDDRDEC